MSVAAVKGFTDPDEVRQFPHGHVDLVNVGAATVGRAEFEPGWRWSQDVKPIAGTESCQAAHTGYVLAGRMHVVMDDGREVEAGPGEAVAIEPGHDAWIVGDETCVMLDFTGSINFAKR
ncbi:cupin domain-containing protein [Actinosynnema sp. NPDC023658]|uniref:cupin domain-containing protein n=1 Tax=Actinosynnema sp. NPDC023658 TaxID=3155465 RepID=UPI00340FAB2A